MALVTAWTRHPEPSLGWPDGCALRPWPLRGSSKRNLSLCFPRGVPRETPALAALWLAAVRKRSGPWFEIRFHRGEFQALRDELVAAGFVHPPIDREISKKRGARGRRRAWRRARLIGVPVKARDALRYLSPNAARDFVAGCFRPYESTSSAPETPWVRVDPLDPDWGAARDADG